MATSLQVRMQTNLDMSTAGTRNCKVGHSQGNSCFNEGRSAPTILFKLETAPSNIFYSDLVSLSMFFFS